MLSREVCGWLEVGSNLLTPLLATSRWTSSGSFDVDDGCSEWSAAARISQWLPLAGSRCTIHRLPPPHPCRSVGCSALLCPTTNLDRWLFEMMWVTCSPFAPPLLLLPPLPHLNRWPVYVVGMSFVELTIGLVSICRRPAVISCVHGPYTCAAMNRSYAFWWLLVWTTNARSNVWADAWCNGWEEYSILSWDVRCWFTSF